MKTTIPSLMAVLTLLAPPAQGHEGNGSSGKSPIVTRPVASAVKSSVTSSNAAGMARRVLNARATIHGAPVLVDYEDKSSAGPPHSGIGWLTTATSTMASGADTATADLNVLVDSKSGGIVAVYTNPGDHWVTSAIAPQDPEWVMRRVGWQMSTEIPAEMESSAIEAIEAAWREEGFNPRRVGQIIARPRWITPKFPARKVGGKIVPVRGTEKIWLVEICGVRLNDSELNGRPFYDTGKIIQFRDGSLKLLGAVYFQ